MWNNVQAALAESAARMVTGAVSLLPGAVALALSIAVAAVVGWTLGLVLRALLRSVEFDRRMAAWGWSELTGGVASGSPSLLAARVVSWFVIVLGILIGLAAFDPTLTSDLVRQLFGSALDLVTALIILLGGNVAARFLSRSVLISLVNMNVPSARLVSAGVKWLIVIMASAMALDHLRIGGRIVELAFGILFGGIVLALALAVGLRSKDLANWSLGQSPGTDSEHEQHHEPFHHL
jgi:hypothetical protein